MKKRTQKINVLVGVVLVGVMILAACTQSTPEPKPIQTNTHTPLPTFTLTPTLTPKPTITKEMTPTSNYLEPSELEGKIIFIMHYSYGFNEEIGVLNLPCINEKEGCQSQITQITNLESYIEYATISPDGKTLVFSSDAYLEFGIYEIYSTTIDHAKPIRLTTLNNKAGGPLWSPDGEKISFGVGDVDGTKVFIYYFDCKCSVLVEELNKYNQSVIWSPDGKKIAFVSGNSFYSDDFILFTRELESGEVIKLTEEGEYFPVFSLHWSPKGDKILYPSGDMDNADICVVDVNTYQKTCLADTELYETAPFWSPDGMKILYVVWDREGTSELFIMDHDGENKTKIATYPGWIINPMWSKNGQFIAFSNQFEDTWRTYMISPDGSWEIMLTETEYEISITDIWTPPP